MSYQLKQKRIAIIGGGPSGLSLARMLQVNDKANEYVIKVYERDLNDHVRIEGGSLDLHEDSGQIFIDKAGLRSEYDKVARVDGGFYTLYTQDNEKVWDKAVPQHPELDRNDMRTLFVNSLTPGTVVWDKHLIKVEQVQKDGGGYLLHFKDDDQPVYCDIVIGADGANSKVRKYISPNVQPHYTGATVIQGDILNPQEQCPQLWRELNQGNMWVLGGSGGQCLAFQQKGDGSIIYFLSFRGTEDWLETTHGVNYTTKDKEAFRRATLSICDGYADIYLNAIKTTDKFFLRKSYGLMYGPALNIQWNDGFNDDERPAITLVGDAAHLMPFFGGVGVNNALVDSVELAEELFQGNHSSVGAAFSVYEKRMVKRCIEAAKWTESMENNFHTEDNIRAVTRIFSGFGPMELDKKWKYLLA